VTLIGALVTALVHGHGGVLIIEGPPVIGKSRLLTEVMAGTARRRRVELDFIARRHFGYPQLAKNGLGLGLCAPAHGDGGNLVHHRRETKRTNHTGLYHDLCVVSAARWKPCIVLQGSSIDIAMFSFIYDVVVARSTLTATQVILTCSALPSGVV
jgi:hypothetical protein